MIQLKNGGVNPKKDINKLKWVDKYKNKSYYVLTSTKYFKKCAGTTKEMVLMTKTTETLLQSANKQEAKVVLDFLEELSQEERQAFMLFVQGARFAKSFEKEKAPA